MAGSDTSVPIEHFIQALTTQLDHAQSAMAVKARNLNLPLTFAVKDLSLDLRAHVEVVKSEVRLRPAGPGEQDTSLVKLSLTTITRPMIDENARPVEQDTDEPSLREAVGDELSDDDRRRLEWAGIRTVSQLRKVKDASTERTLESVANLPVERLRRALQRASAPQISTIEPMPATDSGPAAPAPPLLRIRGRNLQSAAQPPRVSIGGVPVPILKAERRELTVAPLAHQLSGVLRVEVDGEVPVEAVFDSRPTDAKGELDA